MGIEQFDSFQTLSVRQTVRSFVSCVMILARGCGFNSLTSVRSLDSFDSGDVALHFFVTFDLVSYMTNSSRFISDT